jgi:hypothetical protein
MKRIILLLTCALAFLLTVPATQQPGGRPDGIVVSAGGLPVLETALACCTRTDRQRCSDIYGGRAFCRQGACLCGYPV